MHRRTSVGQPRSIKSLRSVPAPNNTLRLASSERTDPSPAPSIQLSATTTCRILFDRSQRFSRDTFHVVHISSKYETTVFAYFWLEDDPGRGGGGIVSELFKRIYCFDWFWGGKGEGLSRIDGQTILENSQKLLKNVPKTQLNLGWLDIRARYYKLIFVSSNLKKIIENSCYLEKR